MHETSERCIVEFPTQSLHVVYIYYPSCSHHEEIPTDKCK